MDLLFYYSISSATNELLKNVIQIYIITLDWLEEQSKRLLLLGYRVFLFPSAIGDVSVLPDFQKVSLKKYLIFFEIKEIH